jgi:flagellar L-ring protein precursor FlgH
MKLITRAILCAMVFGAGAAAAHAGSIWEKASVKAHAIHSDDTARRRGDSITVVVVERSSIANDTNRKLEKKDERTANMSGTFDPAKLFAKPLGKNVFTFPVLDYTSSGETKFDGKSTYGNDNSLTDQVTVTVQDVLPSGDLVIAGTRVREVDGDRQTIQISGIVRPSDIAFDNTVSSTKVANFKVAYSGKGPASQYTRPGWLARLIDLFNPF